MTVFPHQVRQIRSKPAAVYVRHRPETTLLYQVIREYWPEFQAELASQPAVMGKVLSIGFPYSPVFLVFTRAFGSGFEAEV